MVRSNNEIGVSSHVLFDAAVDDAITTTGGGATGAKVAADDETDCVVIDITTGKNGARRMREGGVRFCLCGLLVVIVLWVGEHN